MLPTAVVIGESIDAIQVYESLITKLFNIIATYVIPYPRELPESDYVILCSKEYFKNTNCGNIKERVDENKIIRLYDATIEDEERINALGLISFFCGNDGNVAELGVKRGDFAKHINKAFPLSLIYLFDTFEGLPDADIVAENELMKERTFAHLKKAKLQQSLTSEEFVLSQLPYPEKAIIKCGYFPESAKDIPDDIMFSFVSIDVDLYEPTLNGLNYFYSHLTQQGVIMIHDYSPHCGVYEAVNKFCSQNNIIFFQLNDKGHSVIIAKV